MRRLCRSADVENPLRIQRQAQEGQRCIRAARLEVKELAEEQTKVEAFGNLNFFQVWEEVRRKLRRSNTAVGLGE
jgi:hypothetical protein